MELVRFRQDEYPVLTPELTLLYFSLKNTVYARMSVTQR